MTLRAQQLPEAPWTIPPREIATSTSTSTAPPALTFSSETGVYRLPLNYASGSLLLSWKNGVYQGPSSHATAAQAASYSSWKDDIDVYVARGNTAPLVRGLSWKDEIDVYVVGGTAAQAVYCEFLANSPLEFGTTAVAAPMPAPAPDRERALAILRSWLEPHESDDQAAVLRQLKLDLKESRRGQRNFFPD